PAPPAPPAFAAPPGVDVQPPSQVPSAQRAVPPAAGFDAQSFPPPPPPQEQIYAPESPGQPVQPPDNVMIPPESPQMPFTQEPQQAQLPYAQEPQQPQLPEYLRAVKTVEEYVGGNVVLGKMFLESKPKAEERLGPDGRPIVGMDGWDRQPAIEGMDARDRPWPPPMGGVDARDRPWPSPMGGIDARDRQWAPPMGGMDARDRQWAPPMGGMDARDRQERPRSRRDSGEFYYDELRRGPSETRIPVKKASEGHARAELVIEKIRQDIEAFDKDDTIQSCKEAEPVNVRGGETKRGPSRDDFDDLRGRRGTSPRRPRDVEEDDREERRPRGTIRSKSSHDAGNFIGAGQVFRYESKPLLLAKLDHYRRDEVDRAARPEDDGGRPRREESADRGRDVHGVILRADDLQEFLLEARTGVKKQTMPPQNKYYDDRQDVGAEIPKGISAAQYLEFVIQANQGVGKVIKPVRNRSPTAGPSPFRPGAAPEVQPFTIQAKPSQAPTISDDEKKFQQFSVQAIPTSKKPETRPDDGKELQQFAVHTIPTSARPEQRPDDGKDRQQFTGMKTEYWSRRLDDYGQPERPPSRGKVAREHMSRGPARHGSPRMVAACLPRQRRGVYDEVVDDVVEYVDYEPEGAGQQFVQMKMVRERGQPMMYQAPRRIPSPQGQFVYDEGQPVPMQVMPMQGMQSIPVQGVPMQMMPMQAVQTQGPCMQGVSMQPMPMQGVPMQGVPMRTVALQNDRRMMRVPMRIDRRLQQVVLQQDRGIPPAAVQMDRRYVSPMPPIQAQTERNRRLMTFQVQQDKRQQKAPTQEGERNEKDNKVDESKTPTEPKVKDVYIETMKEPRDERVLSEVNIQVTESRRSKATTARVKTRMAASATHEAGTMRNVELQAEMDEEEDKVELGDFSRDPNFMGSYPAGAFVPPGYPYPVPGPAYQQYQAYQAQAQAYQAQVQALQAVQSSYSVQTTHSHDQTHSHDHHHRHDTKPGYKITYLVPPRRAELKRAEPKRADLKIQSPRPVGDVFEDQEPLVAAVGVQCQSFYERFLRWLYPDTKPTEDRSLMTEPEEMLEDSKKPLPSKKSEEGSKKPLLSKKSGEDSKKPHPSKKSEEDAKKGRETVEGKVAESTKPGAEGDEPEKKGKEDAVDNAQNKVPGKDEEKTEEKGEGKGTKEEKRDENGAAKDAKKDEKTSPKVNKGPPGPPIPVNLPWKGHEYEYEEQVQKDGTCVGRYSYKGLGGGPKSIHSPQSPRSPRPDRRNELELQQLPSGYRQVREEGRRHEAKREAEREECRSHEVTGEADRFVPEVQIRLDFDDLPKRDSKSKKSGRSGAWEAPNMVVSYAHKTFDESACDGEGEDDDDDNILQS
ncbi:unnamed protein product, partial [Ixodes hexagonus]